MASAWWIDKLSATALMVDVIRKVCGAWRAAVK
jgi:hypothetical protein